MNKRNIVLKEASLIFIASVVILSTIAASGYSNDFQIENEKYFTFSNVEGISDIVWDNDMNYTDFMFAQWDEVHNYDATTADDFMFTENTTVRGINWIGGYAGTGYDQASFDWAIVFYDDDDTGNAPGIITHTYVFPQSQCNPVELEDTGTMIYYHLSKLLPETLVFQANTKYWVTTFGIGVVDPGSLVGIHDVPILLHYAVHGSNYWGIPYWSDTNVDLCFQLTKAKPDLDCMGYLTWTGVKPGSPATGGFLVENIGVSDSELDWEVTNWPNWGEWTFTPINGDNLRPEDGEVSVEVKVIAPNDKNSEFEGEIKIVNKEDPSDFSIIDVSLTTPKNKAFNFYLNILMWLFERFPNAFPILRYIIGL